MKSSPRGEANLRRFSGWRYFGALGVMVGIALSSCASPAGQAESTQNVPTSTTPLAALTSEPTATTRPPTPVPEPAPLDRDDEPPTPLIRLPVNLYIVDASDNPELGSTRTVTEVTELVPAINRIWAQAGIELDVAVGQVTAPDRVLADLQVGDATSFVDALRTGTIEITDRTTTSGFLIPHFGFASGATPTESRVFVVVDRPRSPDAIVVAHELGHILGLDHVEDSRLLMDTNWDGDLLTAAEVATARDYAAPISTLGRN